MRDEIYILEKPSEFRETELNARARVHWEAGGTVRGFGPAQGASRTVGRLRGRLKREPGDQRDMRG